MPLVPTSLRKLFIACTFTAAFASAGAYAQCPFAVSDASSAATAVTDGLLLVRAAQGARDAALTARSGSTRSSDAIVSDLATNEQRLDVNGNGAFDETDALIIARYLTGARDEALILGGAGVGALRKTGADVQSFIEGGCVAPAPTQRKKLSEMKAEQMALNNGGVFISVFDNVEIDKEGIDLSWLEIQGTLTCADRNLSVSSGWIIVHGGRFQCGTALNPFDKNLTLTLTGPSSNDAALGAGMGTKVLGVMHVGAQLRLFGENRQGWSQLSANAAVGATSITLKEAVPTWRVGDQLVIAPSGFDAEDFDRVTVTSISGSTVNFSPALRFAHWGTLQTFAGKTLDQRAAVGLLSRNIVIQGDAQSETAKFGGHIMSMINASTQLSGVELRKMGQRGRFGRYPMHWHLGNDRGADFIRNSSIHSSFQRAVVMHGTNKVTVEGNVAFDITNHAFVWAEDGNESGNRFIKNLAVFNKNPIEAEFAFPTNSTLHANSTQAEFRSASF
jgi:G8 domain